MPHLFRSSAIALLLATASVSAIAQTTTVTTTTETRGPSPLDPVQRTEIYRTVTHERHIAPGPAVVPVPAPVARYEVGAPLPRDVQLNDFPEDAYIEVPALRRYRYVYVDSRLVLVDPATSQVVDVITEE